MRSEIEAAADRYERMAQDDDDDAASDRESAERSSSSSSSPGDDGAAEDAMAAGDSDLAKDAPADRLSCVSLGESCATELPGDFPSCSYPPSPPPALAMSTRERVAPVEGTSDHSNPTFHLSPPIPDDASLLCCCSAACREHAEWKDARIRELQRALDHMVDAMAIQQRDLAAQRALVARQSEQFLRLSAALQQEKLALQIARERTRGSVASPASNSSTPRAGASSKKLKGALATLSPRTERRPPPAVDARSSSWTAATEAAAAAVADELSSNRASDDSSLVEVADTRRTLAALEVRATLPQPPAAAAAKSQSAPPLSDVSLQDSPVRVGSRSATNDAAASGGGSGGRKPTLGERFRSLKWKAASTT